MTRTDRRLLRETRAGRTQLLLTAGLGLATAAIVVAQAALLARLITGAAVHHQTLARLSGPLAALACVIAVRALLGGAFEVSGRIGATRVMSELRGRLAEHLLIRSPVPREGERTGELAAAVVQGVESLEAYFAGYLPQLVLAAAVPLAVLIWVVPLDPVAGGVLALSIPILIVFMILIGKGAQAQARSRWRALALLSGHFLDVVRGLQTLRAHRREAAQADTIKQIGDRYRAETMGTLRIAFLSALVLELCAMIGTAFVAATIGIQLDGGHLTLLAGLTVLLLCPELYGPLRAVGQQFHASADGLAAAERILSVLDEPATLSGPATLGGPATLDEPATLAMPASQRSRPRQPADPATAALRFEAVSFSYPDREELVLDGFGLVLKPGCVTALIGRSGAGKSTVAALALRLIDPTAGRITCGAVDLRELHPDEWRRQVAWIPQRARLFAGTIAENIALGAPNAGRGAILAAASEAGLGELLAELRDGLDTPVGDGGRRLSAGQAQRIALGRAFLRDARLVVLDEPTAHLDAESAAAVGGAIERLAVGRTTLLIAHDTKLVAHADRIVEMEDGRAVARDPRRAMAAAA
jgi:thiol reductant ABC exporter CydD subunit